MKYRESMTKEEAERYIRQTERLCRGPLPQKVSREISELLHAGRLEEARKLDSANRKGCGYDFNDVILKNPLDGKLHSAKCPRCGTHIYYTPPKIEII